MSNLVGHITKSSRHGVTLTAVTLTFIFSLDDDMSGVVALPRAEHGAEDGQCAREQPRGGGRLLCERLLAGAHLLRGGAVAGSASASF